MLIMIVILKMMKAVNIQECNDDNLVNDDRDDDNNDDDSKNDNNNSTNECFFLSTE